jgi:single-stranded DNA-binding protein
MPKDVSQWVGQKTMVTQIDKARQEMQMFGQRNDIGGEPVQGIPSQQPTFVSRPGQQQSVGPPPQPQQQNQPQGQPQAPPTQVAMPQRAIPSPSGYNQASGIPMPA